MPDHDHVSAGIGTGNGRIAARLRPQLPVGQQSIQFRRRLAAQRCAAAVGMPTGAGFDEQVDGGLMVRGPAAANGCYRNGRRGRGEGAPPSCSETVRNHILKVSANLKLTRSLEHTLRISRPGVRSGFAGGSLSLARLLIDSRCCLRRCKRHAARQDEAQASQTQVTAHALRSRGRRCCSRARTSAMGIFAAPISPTLRPVAHPGRSGSGRSDSGRDSSCNNPDGRFRLGRSARREAPA